MAYETTSGHKVTENVIQEVYQRYCGVPEARHLRSSLHKPHRGTGSTAITALTNAPPSRVAKRLAGAFKSQYCLLGSLVSSAISDGIVFSAIVFSAFGSTFGGAGSVRVSGTGGGTGTCAEGATLGGGSGTTPSFIALRAWQLIFAVLDQCRSFYKVWVWGILRLPPGLYLIYKLTSNSNIPPRSAYLTTVTTYTPSQHLNSLPQPPKPFPLLSSAKEAQSLFSSLHPLCRITPLHDIVSVWPPLPC